MIAIVVLVLCLPVFCFFCFDLLHLLIAPLFLLCDVGMLGVVLVSVVASVCFLCAHLL